MKKEVNNNKYVYFFVKRLFDIILSLLGLIILSPVLIIVAILIKIDSKGPAFFVQERIGKNGKIIKIFKYRSMVINAEEKLEKLMQKNPEIKKEYTENKKLSRDPRITKMGYYIRRYSVDELPQLLNVLIGNMSLVGPRPYLPREQKDMGKYYNDVIKCKPGITGLWQVSGRSDVSFNERLKLDKEYAAKRGLVYDIKIFFRTFGAVLGKKGAK